MKALTSPSSIITRNIITHGSIHLADTDRSRSSGRLKGEGATPEYYFAEVTNSCTNNG